MKSWLITLTIVSGLLLLDAQSNYCNRNLCPNGAVHIACNNNGGFSSNCASNPTIITITLPLKRNILRKHNKLRGLVARGGFNGFPAARRMATMQWDNELANLAALNVKQCVMQHDACRNTQRFPFAGQNLAFTSWFGQTRNVNQIAMQHIQLWFNEYRQTTPADLSSFPQNANGRVIGHFTQMMQQKANRVGCAILRQQRGTTTDQFMACNYAYTNIFGKPVYQTGPTASGCFSGRNRVFVSLCSIRETYNHKVNYF